MRISDWSSDVCSSDLFTHFAARVGCADFLLDTLGGGFANQAAVVTAHISDDRFVETVAAQTYGLGIHHTVEGDQGDFSGTTTDVDDHRTTGLFDRQAGTDGSGHRFFDQEHFTGTSAEGRFTAGATLHLGGLEWHADQHARAGLHETVFVTFVDEDLQHLFTDA